MSAGNYQLNVEAGTTYSRVFTWSAGSPAALVDLTGYAAHMQIRDHAGAVQVDLTPGAGLSIGGSAGTITLALTPAQTTSLVAGEYDLKLTAPDATVTRLLQGAVGVSPEVTV